MSEARDDDFREMFAGAETAYSECHLVRQFLEETVWPIVE